MKIIDKFLKILKTDRNTFVTYILTLITIYLVIDRASEILIMIFTGIGSSYWGPIKYALAFACPIFAFLFSCSSKFADSENTKVSFFYLYVISLYLLIISMITQMVNGGCWLLLLSAPSYPTIATEFSSLIAPAFRGISLYFPLTTFYPVIKWLMGTVNDTPLILESLYAYKGIKLSSDSSKGTGQFSCEIKLCTDKRHGGTVKISENKRFESMLVVGTSGSGKTSLIFEPMIARDIEKKHFFKKTAKEYGFAALKAGIATLNCPYDNDYINENFSLNMISANTAKMSNYKSCMKKMIHSSSDNKIIYKDLGLTYISPDYESTSRILKVANNYHVKVNLIDPKSIDTIGLNPFIYDNPIQVASIISMALKNISNSTTKPIDIDIGFADKISTQAIENLSILLKIMYPRMNDGQIPTLEDLLSLLNNFNIVEEMCKEMETDTELSEKYNILLNYFKKYFYSDSQHKADIEKYITPAITQLDNLLRYPETRNILCKRSNNINFDSALSNGEFTLLCTRRGDLGESSHKSLGLFFLLSMQYAVLRRPGIESSRIPHFLYIDEFSDFVCDFTESIFTLYRKYRVGTVISIQNLDQLNVDQQKHRKTIIANCAHKVVFGNNEPGDNDWWSKELGEKDKWDFKVNYDTEKGEYSKTLSGIEKVKKPKFKPGKIQSIGFKQCFYKIRDDGGKNVVGEGILNFLDSKYKEEQKEIKLNFTKFTNGMSEEIPNKKNIQRKKTEIPTFSTSDDSDEELDPIKTLHDSSIFNKSTEDDAIINLNKKNNNT